MSRDRPNFFSLRPLPMFLKKLVTPHNLFMLLLLLSLVGVALSDMLPIKSHTYWLMIMQLFSVTAIVANVVEGDSDQDGVPLKKEFTQQVLHWLGCIAAVLVVFGFYHIGRLAPEATGLVVLLILAITTCLDGIQLGWRFSFAGVFLGLMAFSPRTLKNLCVKSYYSHWG